MKKFLKLVYNWFPFKPVLFKLIRSVTKLPESSYRHLHFKGIIQARFGGHSFQIHHRGQPVENDIFWAGLPGNWEKGSVKIWIELCAIKNNILDVGANSGVYSLIAKAVNPKAVVHCFEPFPAVFNLLNENISLNQYDIKSHKLALSNYSGDGVFYVENEDYLYSATVNQNLWHGEERELKTVTIQVDTLQHFATQNNLGAVDLIKLDVELHEPEVLEGMDGLLTAWKPDFIIEILNDTIALKLEHYFNGLGYLYFNIEKSGKLVQQEKLTAAFDYNFLICQPETAKALKLI